MSSQQRHGRERSSELSVSPLIGWLAPLVGVMLFTITVRVWSRQSRHYQSSGS